MPLVLLLLVSTHCYGLTLIANKGVVISATPWSMPKRIHSSRPSQMTLTNEIPMGLPAHSHATPGSISSGAATSLPLSIALFVIGDDKISRKWLFEHQTILKKITAIGLITNIEKPESIERLQKKTSLPILPCNIDMLLKILNLEHYPFLIYQSRIWQ